MFEAYVPRLNSAHFSPHLASKSLIRVPLSEAVAHSVPLRFMAIALMAPLCA